MKSKSPEDIVHVFRVLQAMLKVFNIFLSSLQQCGCTSVVCLGLGLGFETNHWFVFSG